MAQLRRASTRALFLTTIPAILMLAGCPLISDHPLSDPAAARIDEELVGEWLAEDPDSDGWRRFSFLPFDERELVGATVGDENSSVDAFRAFTTLMEDERFLNVRELGEGDSGWYILRYRIEGRRLVMRLVDDALFEGESFAGSAEFYDFVRRNRSNPLLYGSADEEPGSDMVWERAAT